VRKIAFVAEKGGVGKTSIAVNVSVGAARRGLRTLVIDADPQGNATLALTGGQGAGDGPTLADVLMGDAGPAEAIRRTTTAGLHLLPADARLADAAVALVNELGRERRLRQALDAVGGFDLAVIDTAPTRGLLTINALAACDDVYAPCDPGLFALAGLASLRDMIAMVGKHLDAPALRLAGVILSRAGRDNLSRDTLARLREAFGPLVLDAVIPAAVAVGEANARGLAVADHAPGSAVAKAFEALVAEIIDGKAERAGGGGGRAAEDDRAGRPGRRRRAS
jgi:chromosome partitioning protein